MKSPAQLIILGLFFLLLKYHPAHAQQQMQFDLSGLPLFWQTVDILKSDRMPTEEQWDQLFQHPAYQQIDRQGQRKRRLIRNMPIAFMPSKKAKLDSILTQTEGFSNFVCSHLVEAAQQRKMLDQFAVKLEKGDLTQKALTAAKQYLPRGTTERFAPPKVYLILFEPNGFGGPNLVLDLLHVIKNSEVENISFIAHEAHHSYRSRLDEIEFPDNKSDDFLLLYAFAGLLEEGIASMLDKKEYPQIDIHSIPEDKRSDIVTFNQAFANAPNTLQQMDRWLQEMKANPSQTAELGKQIHSSLTWGGHPDGLYMALAIEKTLGRKKLIATNDDPFEFFMVYNKAAKKSKGGYYRFSKESEAFVKELRKRYVK